MAPAAPAEDAHRVPNGAVQTPPPVAIEIDRRAHGVDARTPQRLVDEEVVEAGEYQNASEAVRDALRVLQQRRREDSLKLKALRAQVKAGTDALERGDFAEIEGAELEGYLEQLTTPAAKRAR